LRLAGFGEGFDELVAEGGDVFGFAAGDEVAILHDFFVDPVGAAFFRSVWKEGQEVTVFPLTTSASTRPQGPWQMAVTGFQIRRTA
jgi:hypothetical protein